MTNQSNDTSPVLQCGDRVQIHNETLQAFYGTHGTVLKICRCTRNGHVTHIDVQMDDLPASEGHATFYPDQISVCEQADRSDEGTQL